MSDQQNRNTAVYVDLVAHAAASARRGPRWAYESADLDLTLLTWHSADAIAVHVNDEVDVVLIGVAGIGEVTVDEVAHVLGAGQALLIPKGTERAIRCTSASFSYLSVHRRRRDLWPTMTRSTA